MSKEKTLFGHPAGLFVLSCTEMWERMCYYGMTGIFVLYLTRPETAAAMGWGGLSDADLKSAAFNYLGWYLMAVYVTPLFGGRLADRYLGRRKAILIGGAMMAAGQFLIALPSALFPSLFFPGADRLYLMIGLAFTVLGNGFFKPNISALVGDLYAPGDKRRDSAFTIFYMGINIGALAGFLLIGFIGEKLHYQAGFFTAGIGMLIGLAVQLLFADRYLGVSGMKPAGRKTDMTLSIPEKLTPSEKNNLWAILIFALFKMLFMAGFIQSAGSLNLFAKEESNLTVLGYELPAAWLQSVNPVFIILFAPLFSALWSRLGRRQPHEIGKAGLAFLLLGVGFLFPAFGALTIGPDMKASLLWLVFGYIFMTAGELCIAPVGLAMVSKFSPLRLTGLSMGIFFLFVGFGSKLSAEVGKFTGDFGYAHIFFGTAALSFICAVMILMFKGKISRLTTVRQDG